MKKKQSFKRKVVSLVEDMVEIRDLFSAQEQSCTEEETLTRQEAELKAKNMEVEFGIKEPEERNEHLQIQASDSAVKCLKELDDSETKGNAGASAASAQSAQLHCFELLKELDEKNDSPIKHEECVIRLVEQPDNLNKDVLARESAQKQLKDEVLTIKHDIMEALSKAEENKECALRKILDKVSTKNFENMKKLLAVRDEEIAKLKDEITILSDIWRRKTKELVSKLEKQLHTDQELKKRVLRLDFFMQEARSQTRKLKRIEKRRDRAIKELRDQLAAKLQCGVVASKKQSNFWKTSRFKIVVSMSMLILGVFSKR